MHRVQEQGVKRGHETGLLHLVQEQGVKRGHETGLLHEVQGAGAAKCLQRVQECD